VKGKSATNRGKSTDTAASTSHHHHHHHHHHHRMPRETSASPHLLGQFMQYTLLPLVTNGSAPVSTSLHGSGGKAGLIRLRCRRQGMHACAWPAGASSVHDSSVHDCSHPLASKLAIHASSALTRFEARSASMAPTSSPPVALGAPWHGRCWSAQHVSWEVGVSKRTGRVAATGPVGVCVAEGCAALQQPACQGGLEAQG